MSVDVHVQRLDKSYRDGERRIEVLRELEMEVAAGETIAVVGPSGSGKSTLLHVLGALDRADAGQVTIGGVDVLGLPRTRQAAFRLETIGFVFQFHELLPDFTALENVMMPARIADWQPDRALERARDLLRQVGLADRANHYANALSGGERQRVALCRALCLQPPLLLADEPTGNLDQKSGDQVFEILLEMSRQRGATAIVVTHNPAIAARCERVVELHTGRLRPWRDRGRG